MTDILVDAAIEECRDRMVRAVEHTKSEFGSIRTGRAAPALVEKLQRADKFGQGFATTEYLAASLLDLDWHTLTDTKPQDVTAFEPSKRPSSPLTSALPRATTGP